MNHDVKICTAAAAILTSAVALAAPATVDELITAIKSKDDKVRGAAWQNAEKAGASAVVPLSEAMAANEDMETARAARRALWKIVRYAGRPGAENERQLVQRELVPLLKSSSPAVRREVLWMLSEIGDEQAVEPMAALLTDPELRQDARQGLQRIPGQAATAALKKAFASAPEEFKFQLAHALRGRGEQVQGYPSQRLVPTRQTSVKPATA